MFRLIGGIPFSFEESKDGIRAGATNNHHDYESPDLSCEGLREYLNLLNFPHLGLLEYALNGLF